MNRRARALVVLAVSACALFASVAGASATSLQFTPGGPIAVGGSLAVSGTFRGIAFTVTCPTVSLSGSVATAPIPETPGAPVGSVASGSFTGCNTPIAGAITAVGLFPWPIQFVFRLSAGNYLYDFAPARILISSVALGLQCLYQGNQGFLIPAAGNTATLLPTGIPLFRDLNASGNCPATITLTGTFALTPTQVITEI